MSSLSSPSERVWWNTPVERVELLWIAIALVWGIIMTIMMPYWHVVGKQNLSNEAYRTTPEAFAKKTQAMVDQYTVRTEEERVLAMAPEYLQYEARIGWQSTTLS